MHFARAILLWDLPREELVDLAAACEADPWLITDREAMQLQRVQAWCLMDFVLHALNAPPDEQRRICGERVSSCQVVSVLLAPSASKW